MTNPINKSGSHQVKLVGIFDWNNPPPNDIVNIEFETIDHWVTFTDDSLFHNEHPMESTTDLWIYVFSTDELLLDEYLMESDKIKVALHLAIESK